MENHLMSVSNQDIWDQYDAGSWVCVATNGSIDSDGKGVLVGTFALEAAYRFPDLPVRLGEYLNRFGSRLFVFRNLRVVSFPTRNVDSVRDDLSIVAQSCKELQESVVKFQIKDIIFPRPEGDDCKTAWEVVKTIFASLPKDSLAVTEEPSLFW